MSLTVAVKAINTCVTAGTKVRNQSIQKRIMAGIDNLSGKLNEIDSKVDLIAMKTDSLIIRDLLAANLALDDIKATGVWDAAELMQLKSMYRVNTALPIEGATCGIRNSQIRVMSYLGLFQIGILENADEKRLVRYVLHMFETGEKIVWEELFPQFYEAVFLVKLEEREKRWAEGKNERKQYWDGSNRDLVSDIIMGVVEIASVWEMTKSKEAIIIREAQKLLTSDMIVNKDDLPPYR